MGIEDLELGCAPPAQQFGGLASFQSLDLGPWLVTLAVFIAMSAAVSASSSHHRAVLTISSLAEAAQLNSRAPAPSQCSDRPHPTSLRHLLLPLFFVLLPCHPSVLGTAFLNLTTQGLPLVSSLPSTEPFAQRDFTL